MTACVGSCGVVWCGVGVVSYDCLCWFVWCGGVMTMQPDSGVSCVVLGSTSGPDTRQQSSLSLSLSHTHTPPPLTHTYTNTQEEYPNVIRIENLLVSLPTDEDLKRAYYEETQAFLQRQRARLQVRVFVGYFGWVLVGLDVCWLVGGCFGWWVGGVGRGLFGGV
jgi:hypothetical protein